MSSRVSSISKRIRWLLLGTIVLSGSFFGTLYLLDLNLAGPGYNVASFPRVDVGQPVKFANGENRTALLEGWSAPEGWGVWSNGNVAALGFVVNAPPDQNIKLIIEGGGFISERLPEQLVEVWSQNTKLIEAKLTKAAGLAIAVPLKGIRFGPSNPLILYLRLPLAASPQQLGISQDGRKLGLALANVRFER